MYIAVDDYRIAELWLQLAASNGEAAGYYELAELSRNETVLLIVGALDLLSTTTRHQNAGRMPRPPR